MELNQIKPLPVLSALMQHSYGVLEALRSLNFLVFLVLTGVKNITKTSLLLSLKSAAMTQRRHTDLFNKIEILHSHFLAVIVTCSNKITQTVCAQGRIRIQEFLASSPMSIPIPSPIDNRGLKSGFLLD